MSESFEWTEEKNIENQAKHGVSFEEAQLAFADPNRRLIRDLDHSETEERWFCLGQVERGILTVRFTYRGDNIRIFGAGFWRRGKKRYEQKRTS